MEPGRFDFRSVNKPPGRAPSRGSSALDNLPRQVNSVHVVADAEGTKARLRAEARDLYLEVGFAHFSLREVARRVGVSAPAVYRHYKSKEALLSEVCASGFTQFGSYLLRALSEATPKARLVRSGELYYRFAIENPRDYRVIFMGDAVPFMAKEKWSSPDATFQFLIDRVRECMQARVLKKRDETEVATIIWAHVHGLVSLRLSGHLGEVGDDDDFARFYARSVERLLAGLAS
jgi:AcrR family transcriptional regulator